MASFNRVVMIGNLTRDPEYKQLNSGQAVCRLGLATNRQFKSKQTGSMVQEVCFVDIDVWGPQAESCNQYLQKGRQVLVEGRLKLDTWQDQNGQNRNKHSIIADRVVFLSSQQTSDEAVGVTRVDRDPKEQEVLDQVENLKAKAAAKKKIEKNNDAPATGEIAFQDEPPFEDDLPF